MRGSECVVQKVLEVGFGGFVGVGVGFAEALEEDQGGGGHGGVGIGVGGDFAGDGGLLFGLGLVAQEGEVLEGVDARSIAFVFICGVAGEEGVAFVEGQIGMQELAH